MGSLFQASYFSWCNCTAPPRRASPAAFLKEDEGRRGRSPISTRVALAAGDCSIQDTVMLDETGTPAVLWWKEVGSGGRREGGGRGVEGDGGSSGER